MSMMQNNEFHIFKSENCLAYRQLAQNQLGWFKKEDGFHWLNIAPKGERLSLEEVAKGVREWFLHNTPLPQDWEGTSLQTLVR